MKINKNYYLDVFLLKNKGFSIDQLMEVYQRSKSWITYVLRRGNYLFKNKDLKKLIKNRLSALIITKNDYQWLIKCLDQLNNFNDVVIVDGSSLSYSKLNSLSLSLDRFKRESFHFPVIKLIKNNFKDFGLQRLKGLPYTTGQWILILDTD